MGRPVRSGGGSDMLRTPSVVKHDEILMENLGHSATTFLRERSLAYSVSSLPSWQASAPLVTLAKLPSFLGRAECCMGPCVLPGGRVDPSLVMLF